MPDRCRLPWRVQGHRAARPTRRTGLPFGNETWTHLGSARPGPFRRYRRGITTRLRRQHRTAARRRLA